MKTLQLLKKMILLKFMVEKNAFLLYHDYFALASLLYHP